MTSLTSLELERVSLEGAVSVLDGLVNLESLTCDSKFNLEDWWAAADDDPDTYPEDKLWSVDISQSFLLSLTKLSFFKMSSWHHPDWCFRSDLADNFTMLGQLHALASLELHHMKFADLYDDQFWLPNTLPNLKSLVLVHNELTTIPKILHATGLTSLRVEDQHAGFQMLVPFHEIMSKHLPLLQQLSIIQGPDHVWTEESLQHIAQADRRAKFELTYHGPLQES